MVLIATACHCVRALIDARRVILIGDPDHCLHFSARVIATGIRTIRSFDFPTVRADFSVPARPSAPSKCYLMPANWSQIAGPSERMTLSF